MGGRSSKSSIPHNRFSDTSGTASYYGVGRTAYQPNDFRSNSANEAKSTMQSNDILSQGRKSVEKQPQEWKQLKEPSLFPELGTTGYGSSEDDFYDGIPRFPRSLSRKSRSIRSKQSTGAKVSEASLRVGKSRGLGLGKAVEVLDTLGSSMTSLNPSSGFSSGVKTKSNELQILAFEVANTIVKGSSLIQSLSKRSIRHLKEVVLTSEGVQHLVSKDMDELLTIVATDRREEFRNFTAEVVRFGNRSKDSQWHNLNRYFEKRSKELAPHKHLQEEAEQMMQQLMTLVMCTAELYNELQAMDRIFEQDYQRKRLEEDNPFATQRGDSLAFLRTDIKSQRKLVKNLKKKSLWSRSLEEVMEKLVDIVLFLNREIQNVFGNADCEKPSGGSLGDQKRLGPSGLALHYANIVIQIDTIVARCNSMPSSLRETLYQNLPPNIKSSLRSKLHSFHVKEGLTVPEIKDEMEKTLQWLVPIAINTAKAHHGFGWVGEWANTGSGANRKAAGPIDVIRVETFHYADKEKTEAYVLELLLWLNHLVKQSKLDAANGGEGKPPMKSPVHKTLENKNQDPVQSTIIAPSPEKNVEDDLEKLKDISKKGGHEEQDSGT
ncbi:protein PSK SIMULATOR 1-like [Actinidia eriantha]|uniref:protein PSK SIMULATOR 1-like n=1 Tax=Actinidia eriantha TaxID=165200 RepID=UPI00258D10A8|nr:protein PSK SIMULATOR 1-like [Actinidia eriantha]